MTLPADHSDILDRISAELAAEEPHLTGMYRVFSKLTFRELIPDEDAVRRLPRPWSVSRGRNAPGPEGGTGGPGWWRGPRGRLAMTGRLARIAALPALLLAILITIIAFTAGGGTHCTRAVSLHGAAGTIGASCRGGSDAAPPPTRG
jgi:hypothetical protein